MAASATVKFTKLLFVISSLSLHSTWAQQPRIAIVGGGIGGNSAGYFLRENFHKAQILLINKAEANGDPIGGRLATVKVNGRDYEIGGSIIHSTNKYMVDYLEKCDLKKKISAPEASFSLHKDGEIVFQEWGYSFLDKARMGIRYGLESALKLEYFVDNMLKSFTGIYSKLDNSDKYYKTVEEILKDMSPVSKTGEVSTEMKDLTSVTLKDKLVNLGVGDLLIDEMVTVATRVNYGQMPNSLHAFVGAVGLAGMDGELWAVEGGNKNVVRCASMKTRSKNLRGEVTAIEKINNEFRLKVDLEGSESRYETVDVVVIATPLTFDVANIKLPGGVKQDQFPGHYHTTVATVVQGNLIPEAVGFKEGSSYTTTNFYLSDDSDIVSIAKLSPVDYNPDLDDNLPSVYKIFSKREFTETELSSMFSDIKFTHSVPWLAYPEYTTSDDFSSFELSPGLYYLNRMEWAASAMEMSVISAKNVAKMATAFIRENITKKVEL